MIITKLVQFKTKCDGELCVYVCVEEYGGHVVRVAGMFFNNHILRHISKGYYDIQQRCVVKYTLS